MENLNVNAKKDITIKDHKTQFVVNVFTNVKLALTLMIIVHLAKVNIERNFLNVIV